MTRSARAMLFLAASLFGAAPAFAQEDAPPTIPFEGPEVVCHVLHGLDFKPITTFKEAAKNPQDTVMIVLGNARVIGDLRHSAFNVKRFLDNGGNLLVATDRRFEDPDLRIHISGAIVQVPKGLSDHYAYGGHATCPLLPLSNPLRGDWIANDHPIFSLLHRGIATNCPSWIDVDANDRTLDDLLSYAFGPIRINDGWGKRGGHRRYMVGSPKDAPPRGRALYIAGHGMFMNGMLLQDGVDNYEFAKNAFRWLREGPDKTTRKYALLVVDGDVKTNFDVKLTAPPSIPMPPAKVFGKLIRGLEDERWFHKTVADALGWRLGLVCAIIAGVATFVLLMYGAKKFIAGRHYLETKVPALLGPQPAMAATAPVGERRQAILHQADYWEEARFLVLKWFRQELDVTPNRWLENIDARFEAEGFFWSRWRLQRQADYVLRLAQIDKPMRVSRHDFFVLFETLRELSAALGDGRVALLVDGKNVKQAT